MVERADGYETRWKGRSLPGAAGQLEVVVALKMAPAVTLQAELALKALELRAAKVKEVFALTPFPQAGFPVL